MQDPSFILNQKGTLNKMWSISDLNKENKVSKCESKPDYRVKMNEKLI